MERISEKDRLILRELAKKQLDCAHSEKNAEIMKKWAALEMGRRETPTVRMPCSNFMDEVIDPVLRCEGETARGMEATLLKTMFGQECFDDDTPIPPTFDVPLAIWADPFGVKTKTTPARERTLGYHIDPVIEDLEAEVDKLKNGSFGFDREQTNRRAALAEEIFGDILPVRMVMHNLQGGITNALVTMMGMEAYYLAMYDCPDTLHQVMDMATTLYENYYDFLERESLLLPTCGTSPISQESYAFNHELPTDRAVRTTDCWGFLESQETTAVSAETFGEFVFPYQDRLVRRFGLLTYGCCERVDDIWPDYLSKWKNLRKLSVSPFNKEPLVGEYLRGSSIVYYSKPRAEFVTTRGPIDEAALRKYFKGVFESASGCLLEVAQREVGTVYGDIERGRNYIRIAKECVQEYWKP